MTFQEAGSRETFYEQLKLDFFKEFGNNGIVSIDGGYAYIDISEDNKLHVPYVEIYISNFDNRYNMTISAHECALHIGKVFGKDFKFSYDTIGIIIFMRLLKEADPDTKSDALATCERAEAIYREKFRGKIQGNKFGF